MAHILLVDDDPSVLKCLARILTLEGHEVVAVATSCDALEGVDRFDVAIMDINLNTDVDGIECARRLVERGRIGEVIFHSATDDPADREAARFLGPFVAKGDIERLRALLPATEELATG